MRVHAEGVIHKCLAPLPLCCAGWHLFISVVHEITVFPYHVCVCVCVWRVGGVGFTDGVIHIYLVALSSCSAPGHLFVADAHEIRVFLYEML